MVGINDVKVAKDLSVADVYVSSIGEKTRDERDALTKVLNEAAGFLRSTIAAESTMRFTPKLRFHYDEVWVRASEIDALIDKALDADHGGHSDEPS